MPWCFSAWCWPASAATSRPAEPADLRARRARRRQSTSRCSRVRPVLFAEKLINLGGGPRTAKPCSSASVVFCLRRPPSSPVAVPDLRGTGWLPVRHLPGNGVVLGPFASYAREKRSAKSEPSLFAPAPSRACGAPRRATCRAQTSFLPAPTDPRHPEQRRDGDDRSP